MQISNFNVKYFVALLLVAMVGTALLLIPFATAMIVAGVVATLLYPWYRWLAMRARLGDAWGSAAACLSVFFLIVLPIIGTVALVTNEVRSVAAYLSAHPEVMKQAMEYIRAFLLQAPFLADLDFASLFQRLGDVSVKILQSTYANVSQFFFWLFIFFFSLFYFFIDGKKIVEKLLLLSPLRNRQEHGLIREFISISRATLKGTVVIGAIQGTLGGLLFFAVGVPSPVTWGVIMIILSIIPVLGSGLVWAPVGIAMLLSGQLWQGAVILAFGFGVISTIDNVLRPKLVGKDSQMHPLFVLLATLGGIIAFGIIGFIIGPIIVALFLALLRIYEQEFASQLREYNKE
jgi:predicted PurR-regulated permease PerM